MGLFSFVFYKEYYYFLIYWGMDLILYIPSLIFKFNNPKIKEEIISLVEYDYLQLLNLNIADLLSGFLVLITYYRMKSEKEKIEIKNKNRNTISLELIYNDFSKKDNKYILILILSILELLARSSNLLFNLINEYKDEQLNNYHTEWIISLDIISRIIFSKIILKTSLYKHHLVSVLIFLFGSLIMTILGIISIINTNLTIKLLFLIPKNIIFGLGDIISKILLTYKFVLPQKLISMKGVFNFGMHLIIFPILWFTNKIDQDIFVNNFDSGIDIIFAIIKLLLSFLKSFCIMKIIDKFSPLHVAFVNVVLCLYQYIISICFDNLNSYIIIFIINIICLIIIIFSTLLFNEIIIINSCGLNTHTKKDILLREKKDNIFENSESRNNSMLSEGIFDKKENLEN
jgi:hypothetical protein